MMNNTSRAVLAAALALSAAPAFAMDTPPAGSPGGSSSGGGSGGSSGGSPASIPEPAALGLFALGIAGAAVIRRRQRGKPD
jgi:hypothetical protein